MANRVNNALTQKLYLIDQTHVSDIIRKYVIMGSTGNIYDVVISMVSKCTCPDNTIRRKTCKHIYFVLFKILQVPAALVALNKLDESIVKYIFNHDNATIDNSILIAPDKKKLYEDLKNNINADRKNDDVCPICLDDIIDLKDTYYCKNSCKKNVHVECFDMWAKNKGPVCVFCNVKWNLVESKYINLL